MFNNKSIVSSVAEQLDEITRRSLLRPPRRRLTSEPTLPSRLPSTGFLLREADQKAPLAILKQLRRTPTPPSPSTEEEVPRTRRPSITSVTSSSSSLTSKIVVRPKSMTSASHWKEPQPFEVFRAVERKDIMFLMEIRDKAFHLLLRKSGDATPLLHAMRIGQSHRDVAIILLGSFSRYVNHLQDDEVGLPQTKKLLKALRTNLKLAIDYGLQQSQSDLVASFLQTLIMSEGDKWVFAQANNISLALRAGTAGKPVQGAGSAVRSFATKELGKAAVIAALEDYIANATADLVMLGAWSQAAELVQGEPIPTWYFARDDRVYKAFLDRLELHKGAILRSCSRRLRWQFRILAKVLEGRSTTYRNKVEILTSQLDEGDGV
ncbi:hypothetical protein FIBSPDRAFT_811645 [Athelia psychrophila]|uniref:Uncharacterized protein n=1 Tax=Athelia psychrophila TaxID=1759441 RepID=A0A166VLT7_9AGAM|nr:hypothetical protein FIBSPDRAFT_811645 [Fibularhizoctonia sp. CBS 109695]